MKILAILIVALMSVSCSKKESKAISDPTLATGSQQDASAGVTYNRSIDRVEIKARDEEGNAVPISFMGTRINAENITQAKAVEVCDLLGFTSPEKASYDTTTASITNAVKNFEANVVGNALDYTLYPVLHLDVVSSNGLAQFFNYLPKVDTFYFDAPTFYECFQEGECKPFDGLGEALDKHDALTNRNYLSSLSCEGTTQVHFNNGNTFNEDNFLQGVFDGLMAEEIEVANNHYSMGYPFLIEDAENIWEVELERTGYGKQRTGNAIMKRGEANFLPHAERGATDICKKSGFDGLLYYNVRYLNSGDVTGFVYRFNGNIWSEGSAPRKFNLQAEDTNGYVVAERTLEVPSVYLGQVYCY